MNDLCISNLCLPLCTLLACCLIEHTDFALTSLPVACKQGPQVHNRLQIILIKRIFISTRAQKGRIIRTTGRPFSSNGREVMEALVWGLDESTFLLHKILQCPNLIE